SRPPLSSTLFPYTTLFRSKMSVAANTFLVINNGGFTNDGAAGQVTNAGTIEVDGAWTNNSTSNVFGATPNASTGGTVILDGAAQDRKSTRLNSSHVKISYA